MKEVSSMPESGQFVMLWEYNGKIWSGVYRWNNTKLTRYHGGIDKWEETNFRLHSGARFFIESGVKQVTSDGFKP